MIIELITESLRVIVGAFGVTWSYLDSMNSYLDPAAVASLAGRKGQDDRG